MPSLCRKRKGSPKVWRASVMVNGIRKVKWFKDASRKSYREAVLWEEEMRKKLTILTESGVENEKKKKEVSVCEWINKYLSDGELRWSQKVYKEKIAILRRFVKQMNINPSDPVSKITPSLALIYLQKQARERSGHAANKERKYLGAAWNWGSKYLDNWPSGPNPFLKVLKFPEIKQPRYIPPEEDFWKVYDVAEEKVKVLLLTFLYTAGRKGEIFNLKWEDIDFANDRIRLFTKKRESSFKEADWLPLVAPLKKALLWIWEHRKVRSEFVFVNEDKHSPYYGQPFKYRFKLMRNLCKRAGVKPFGFHAIRHLTATILFKQGYPVSVIQKILRHRSPYTTEKYLHSLGLTETMKKALEEIGKDKRGIIKFAPKFCTPGNLKNFEVP